MKKILIIMLLIFISYITYPIKTQGITITDSYNIWSPKEMSLVIEEKYHSSASVLLNRSYGSICIEWWLHNIGYYITKPFCSVEIVYNINLRFKDVDLEEFEQKINFRR